MNGNLPARRPAETSGVVAGAAAALLIAVFDLDAAVYLVPLTIVAGSVPAVVTWIVTLVRGTGGGGGRAG